MRLNGNRPGDERAFLHKSFIGRAVGSVVRTVVPAVGVASGIVSTAKGLIGGGGGGPVVPGPRSFGRGRGRATVSRTTTARVTPASMGEKELGRAIKFPGGGGGFPGGGGFTSPGPCDFPKVRDSEGRCRMPTSGKLGGEQFGVGEAVMGRYGAALEPGSQIVDRAICLPGMQLGDDGLCYNKGQITNKQRMWPAGRKPLLTGGDLRAISIAARAGRRMDQATKRLQKMGMMKKPAARGARRALPAHQHAKQIAAVSV